MTPPSIRTALQHATAALEPCTESARLDAEVLLAQVLGKPRSHLHAWPERTLTPAQAQAFSALLDRRLRGEPVAHILGRREFWSLEFEVTPATLIPRPETERLVECTLEHIPRDAECRVADLGTGSGAIAVSIARERPRCQVTATDLSADALAIARRNAERMNVANVSFRQGAWYEAISDERFDVIVSNPPYIPHGDPHLQRGDVRFDPGTALVAGVDGLDALRIIIGGARAHLRPGGWLLVEHGYDQAEAVAGLFVAAGLVDVGGQCDLSGQPRVTCGRAPTI